jgi:hypothetical protein
MNPTHGFPVGDPTVIGRRILLSINVHKGDPLVEIAHLEKTHLSHAKRTSSIEEKRELHG